ncbi:General substrate transporter [Niveomyces insectorum RCEF 264]|uniref:General substrate transporter n=1 Tax=Niveomyces insectorum RCEF 264 TaxID=1081102 RepID=A0A167X692_9HYPO|nr:General substrate transporter [Niveomyces insectorum RCEF 264]
MPYLGLEGNGLLTVITITTGMGFILFGYDDGVMGGLLTAPSFTSVFHLSSAMQGTITSMFTVGAFFGCAISALFNGRFGRKPCTFLGAVLVGIGAVLQSASYQVAQLLVGRIVAGVGLGLVVANIIMWQSELSPGRIRGLLVASALTFLILGDLIALWIEYGIANRPSSYAWRLPLALQAALALILSGLLLIMPESPRWLFQNNRESEGLEILTLLNTHKGAVNEEELNKTVKGIQEAIAIESEQSSWQEFFKGDNLKSRQRVVLACILNACQAWSGSTPISYYTTYIFENSVGLSYNTSLLLAGVLQIFRMCASVGTWWSIEKLGRRFSLMATSAGMTVVLAIMAAMVSIDSKPAGIVASVMLFLFEAFYAWGFMGPIWVYGPEIIPLAHRAKGEGLATACLWLSSFVTVEIVPPAIHNIGWKVYLIFACANLSFIPFTYFFLPETAGLSLEAIDLCFMDSNKSPVQKANELVKELKRGHDVSLDRAFDDDEKVAATSQVEYVRTNEASA